MLKISEITEIITHADCPDGMASAMICRAACRIAAAHYPSVRFVQHGSKELLELPAQPGMVFVDMSPPPDRVEEFLAVNAIVLDHHVTAKPVVDAFVKEGLGAFGEHDECGATLAYQCVWCAVLGKDKHVQGLAALAAIRDTWQNVSPNWEAACAQAQALLFWPSAYLLNLPVSRWGSIVDVGEVLFKRHLEACSRAAAGALRFTVDGLTVAMHQNSRLTSDTADITGAMLTVGFDMRCEGTEGNEMVVITYSLRSRSPFDCSAFAKANGGGGHVAAAGFTITIHRGELLDPYANLKRLLVAHIGCT